MLKNLLLSSTEAFHLNVFLFFNLRKYITEAASLATVLLFAVCLEAMSMFELIEVLCQ